MIVYNLRVLLIKTLQLVKPLFILLFRELSTLSILTIFINNQTLAFGRLRTHPMAVNSSIIKCRTTVMIGESVGLIISVLMEV